jgi:hypothetical protein
VRERSASNQLPTKDAPTNLPVFEGVGPRVAGFWKGVVDEGDAEGGDVDEILPRGGLA